MSASHTQEAPRTQAVTAGAALTSQQTTSPPRGPSLSDLPDEISPDGSCYVSYTRCKAGRIVAAHCTRAMHAPRKRITLRQQSQLQKLESLFS